jgi:hypothetical protein
VTKWFSFSLSFLFFLFLKAFSELETDALRRWAEANPVTVALDVHSYGNVIAGEGVCVLMNLHCVWTTTLTTPHHFILVRYQKKSNASGPRKQKPKLKTRVYNDTTFGFSPPPSPPGPGRTRTTPRRTAGSRPRSPPPPKSWPPPWYGQFSRQLPPPNHPCVLPHTVHVEL